MADLTDSPANGVGSNAWNTLIFIQDTTVKSTSSGALGGSGTLADPWIYRIAQGNGTLKNADHVVIWPKAGFDGNGCGWADAVLDTSVTPNIVTERSGGFGTPNPSGQNVSSTGQVQWTYNNTSTVGYTFQDPYFNIAHTSPSKTTYTFASASALTANVLMVAGGAGGGGRAEGGGGGAGGLVYTAGTSLAQGVTKTIVVGNGDSGGIGTGGSEAVGFSGKNTTFTDLDTAFGGGGGGSQTNGPNTGGSGGGGNGGDASNYNFNTGASGTSNQGIAGGNGANTLEGGGGGGAGGVGANASSGNSGDGGIGKFFGTGSSFTNFGDEYGEGGYFAGGGGGGNRNENETIPGGRGGGGYGGQLGRVYECRWVTTRYGTHGWWWWWSGNPS